MATINQLGNLSWEPSSPPGFMLQINFNNDTYNSIVKTEESADDSTIYISHYTASSYKSTNVYYYVKWEGRWLRVKTSYANLKKEVMGAPTPDYEIVQEERKFEIPIPKDIIQSPQEDWYTTREETIPGKTGYYIEIWEVKKWSDGRKEYVRKIRDGERVEAKAPVHKYGTKKNTHTEIKIEFETIPIPVEEEIIESTEFPKGTPDKVEAGQEGQKKKEIEYTYDENGKVLSSRILSETVVRKAIKNKRIRYTGSIDTKKYLWQRLRIEHADGTIEYKGCRCLSADAGEKGRGVENLVNLYYLSDSSSETIGGDWVETQPKWKDGKYLWIKQKILFDDGTETETKAILSENTNRLYENSAKIIQELENITSQFTQTAESVVMGVVRNYSKITDLENLKTEITNQMITNKSGFNFEFKSLEEKISRLGKEVNLQKKWIRLVNGEIHMGRDDSPIDTVYTNKSLEFRYNGTTVAQFTNDILTVRNIEVKNQLRLSGEWAIRPGEYIRGKGYNLDDVWLGGEA